MTLMRRTCLPDRGWSNPGLRFDKGFPQWERDSAKRGESVLAHITSVADIGVPDIYMNAFDRWLTMTLKEKQFVSWFGVLESRLQMGAGGGHVLESQVTRHAIYGIPVIPGTAVKGVARSAARGLGLDPGEINTLFGTDIDDMDKANAGYLIFHDAWWVPHTTTTKNPYVCEVTTLHATDYFKTKGRTNLHIDMESPNPNFQLAVQGSFYFTIEGDDNWAEFGLEILKIALQDHGIGGKVGSGYGYFDEDETTAKNCHQRIFKAIQVRDERSQRAQDNAKALDARLERAVTEASMSDDDLAFSKVEQLLSEHRPGGRISEEHKGNINRSVNELIEQVQHSDDNIKTRCLDLATQCYTLTLKSKPRTKKIDNLKRTLNIKDTDT